MHFYYFLFYCSIIYCHLIFAPFCYSESETHATEQETLAAYYETFQINRNRGYPISRTCYRNDRPVTIRIRDCSIPVELQNNSYTLVNTSHLAAKIDNSTYAIICHSFAHNPIICIAQTLQDSDQQRTLLIFQAIGITLDVVSCILYIGTFVVFSDMRTIFGKLVINLILVILFGDVFYLMSLMAPEEDLNTERYCEVTAILTHFLFLSRFAWMTVLSIYVGKTFYSAWKMNQPTKDKKKNAITLCLGMSLGYGTPGCMVILCVCVNYTVTNSMRYGRTLLGTCWISNDLAIYLAYITPIAISIFINFILSIFSIIVLVMIRKNAAKKATDLRRLLQDCRVVFGICSIMGVSWLFAFLALVDIVMSWAWYPFVILSTSQAAFLSIAFLAKQDVFNFYSNKFSSMSSNIRQSVYKRLSIRSTSISSTRTAPSVVQVNKSQDKSLSNAEEGSLTSSPSNEDSGDLRKERGSEGLQSPSASFTHTMEDDLME